MSKVSGELKGNWERQAGGSFALLPWAQVPGIKALLSQATAPSLPCTLFPSQADSLWIPRKGIVAWTRAQSAFLPSAR